MEIVQLVRLRGRRACSRRASAGYCSNVSAAIARVASARPRATCCAGACGRMTDGVNGDERGHGDIGRRHREGDHGRGG